MKLNPDKEKVKIITEALKENDGYCPCMLIKTEDTKCPCEYKRNKSICICGLYIIEEGEGRPLYESTGEDT